MTYRHHAAWDATGQAEVQLKTSEAALGRNPAQEQDLAQSRSFMARARRLRYAGGSDQRIHVPATGTYTYPDASVTCGKVEAAPKDKNSIVNPLLLVEVLSQSTQEYDLGEKFRNYRSIPSLQEVLFLSQTEQFVVHHRKVEDRWIMTERRSGSIEVLGGALSVDDLYAGVDLLEEDEE